MSQINNDINEINDNGQINNNDENRISEVRFELKNEDSETNLERSNQLERGFNLDKYKTLNSRHKNNINNETTDFCVGLKRRIKNVNQNVCKKLKDKNFYKRIIQKRIPIIGWLPNYKLNYLFTDLIAGLTVGILNIPQSLAYSLIATLNPVNGLYISFFPSLVYTIFGSCKHLTIGAIAIVSLLSGSIIDSVSNEFSLHPLEVNGTPIANTTDKSTNIAVASSLSLLVGMIQFLMGLCGLGVLSSYFSDTFISGYTCGSAIYVVVSQLKDIFGLKNIKRASGMFKVPKVYFNSLNFYE
jgi:hypothetical protein